MVVFVAGGQQLPKNKKYIAHAKKLGELLGKSEVTFVQGGTEDGIMGLAYKEFIRHSDNVEIIVPKAYAYQVKGMKYRRLHSVDLINDRLNLLLKLCDFVFVLTGGLGTLDEFVSAIESKRAGEHQSKLVLINSEGFFDSTIKQLKRMVRTGFIKFPIFEMFSIVKTPEEAIELMKNSAVKTKLSK